MNDKIETGESKLEAVKKTAKRIIKNLTDKDELSIVTFEQDAAVLIPKTKVINKDLLLAKVATIQPLGGTNMSAGLLLGMEQIKDEFRGVKRTMLLSDGDANVGVCRIESLVEMTKNGPTSISTFSYGANANQELMQAIANAKDGNHTYIQGGDVRDSFARELGGMLSCVSQNTSIKIVPNRGNEILELLNAFDLKREEDVVTVNVSDVYAGEKKHLIFRVRLKPPMNPKDREFSVAKIHFTCLDPKSAERKEFEFNPKVAYANPDKSDVETILAVEEQVAILLSVKSQEEAVKVRASGDVKKMKEVLGVAKARLVEAQKRGSNIVEDALLTHDFITIAMEEYYNREVAAMVTNSAYAASKGRAGSTGYSGYSGFSASSFSGLSGHSGFSGISGFSGSGGYYSTKAQHAMSKKFLDDEEEEKKQKP